MSDATAAADLMFRPVGELAGLVRSGELSARELVQSSLDRIEALDGELNAFVDVWAEEALADADAIGPGDERPFAGVPIAIKNNRAVEGRRLTYGADLFGDFRAPMDHNVVRRLKAAGFVLVGSTTLPEFGILPVTETRRFGPTRNPWDPSRTPGGSSGGSAAAVAAGMVPIAHGNDGGGSIRIPAACCGLVGLKPQRGRISLGPEAGGLFLVVDGVLTRTVSETAQVLDVLAGYELGDAWWAPDPDRALRRPGDGRARPAAHRRHDEVAARQPRSTPRAIQATEDAAELLRSLGHEVVEAEAPWGDPSLLRDVHGLLRPRGLHPDRLRRDARRPRARRRGHGAAELGALPALQDDRLDLRPAGRAADAGRRPRASCSGRSQFDAVMTPALAEAPVPLGTIDPQSATPLEDFARSGQFTPYTAIGNVTGSPGISLPLYERRPTTRPGLPLGVQLFGQPAGEGALLALAAQLEAAQPWADRRPPVS